MVEGYFGAVSDGGVSIEPWQIPRRGGSTGVGGKEWATSPTGTPPQGNSSTGIGGVFGTASWAGKLPAGEHRGFWGGEGIRTGGYA